MIKKNYMSPVVEILDMRATKLLAGSIVENGGALDVIVDDEILPGDAGEAAAPEYEFSEELKAFFTIVLLLMMSLTISAQNFITK